MMEVVPVIDNEDDVVVDDDDELNVEFWRMTRFMELTEGTFFSLHTPCSSSFSRISHAKMVGVDDLMSMMERITFSVATLGFDPPMMPGMMLPVEL